MQKIAELIFTLCLQWSHVWYITQDVETSSISAIHDTTKYIDANKSLLQLDIQSLYRQEFGSVIFILISMHITAWYGM